MFTQLIPKSTKYKRKVPEPSSFYYIFSNLTPFPTKNVNAGRCIFQHPRCDVVEQNMEVRAFAECPGVAGRYLSMRREWANCYARAFGECPEYLTVSEKGLTGRASSHTLDRIPASQHITLSQLVVNWKNQENYGGDFAKVISVEMILWKSFL